MNPATPTRRMPKTKAKEILLLDYPLLLSPQLCLPVLRGSCSSRTVIPQGLPFEPNYIHEPFTRTVGSMIPSDPYLVHIL